VVLGVLLARLDEQPQVVEGRQVRRLAGADALTCREHAQLVGAEGRPLGPRDAVDEVPDADLRLPGGQGGRDLAGEDLDDLDERALVRAPTARRASGTTRLTRLGDAARRTTSRVARTRATPASSRRAAARTSCAAGSSSRPAGVSVVPARDRSKSRTPRVRSSPRTSPLTVGWASPSSSAARPKCPVRASVAKTVSRRSVNCIGVSL
jgi:hypothetical protein